MSKYNLAKAYFGYYGNLEVPVKFKTSDGVDYNENGVALGTWINNQRQAYKGNGTHKITIEHIELLNEIGMRWENKLNLEKQWINNYNLAKTYYNHYGNLEIPKRFKTSNGMDYDENGKKLINRALSNGHTVGIHCYDHTYKKIYSSVNDGVSTTYIWVTVASICTILLYSS